MDDNCILLDLREDEHVKIFRKNNVPEECINYMREKGLYCWPKRCYNDIVTVYGINKERLPELHKVIMSTASTLISCYSHHVTKCFISIVEMECSGYSKSEISKMLVNRLYRSDYRGPESHFRNWIPEDFENWEQAKLNLAKSGSYRSIVNYLKSTIRSMRQTLERYTFLGNYKEVTDYPDNLEKNVLNYFQEFIVSMKEEIEEDNDKKKEEQRVGLLPFCIKVMHEFIDSKSESFYRFSEDNYNLSKEASSEIIEILKDFNNDVYESYMNYIRGVQSKNYAVLSQMGEDVVRFIRENKYEPKLLDLCRKFKLWDFNKFVETMEGIKLREIRVLQNFRDRKKYMLKCYNKNYLLEERLIISSVEVTNEIKEKVFDYMHKIHCTHVGVYYDLVREIIVQGDIVS